ncbi:MYG1 family protein [Roseiconus lacunae]|uniref:MYG1 family protein n=1 Tax=Roseiconus lacunae TaxID=2605694 RepID=A0ABT7PS98_9BACT|nr:MYG1 family protein [Roseiconus lacunae]MDM4019378.1 MYG1 family protein [Roseiconus lacunae]
MAISSERPDQSTSLIAQHGQLVRSHATQTPSRTMQAKQTTAKESRTSEKIKILAEVHGERVLRFIADGRVSPSALDNFYGRHTERQTVILDAMEQGASYSAAYSNSSGCFDTTSWAKLARRTATVRGLVLTSVTRVLKQTCCDAELPGAISLYSEIGSIADQLLETVADHALIPAPKPNVRKSGQRKSGSDRAEVDSIIPSLRIAKSKFWKNLRDAQRFVGKTGELPSVKDAARIAIECARIRIGIKLMELSGQRGADNASAVDLGDYLGIGSEYWSRFPTSLPIRRPERTIATHNDPYTDALVATWMAERYLYANNTCQVAFIPRTRDQASLRGYDAVMDIGCVHEPLRHRFDHKPPAFEDRNEHCAASLVFRHLADRGVDVEHLSELVTLVHDGDAVTRRGKSEVYAHSRERGLHAVVQHAKAYATSDAMCFQGVAVYLDAVWCGDDKFFRRSNRI